MERLQVRLPADMRRKLEAIAHIEGRTIEEQAKYFAEKGLELAEAEAGRKAGGRE